MNRFCSIKSVLKGYYCILFESVRRSLKYWLSTRALCHPQTPVAIPKRDLLQSGRCACSDPIHRMVFRTYNPFSAALTRAKLRLVGGFKAA